MFNLAEGCFRTVGFYPTILYNVGLVLVNAFEFWCKDCFILIFCVNINIIMLVNKTRQWARVVGPIDLNITPTV